MEKTVFFDLETLPDQSPDAIAEAMGAVKPPASYKKQESIDAWLSENAEIVAKEAVSKTSFDPARGHICTIAWAVDDGAVTAAHARTIDQEADVLRAFFADIGDHHRKTWVGHFIGGFDIRFLLCRAVVLGVKIPRCIPRDPKPWDKAVFDTMTAWAGARGTISMDNLAKALGLSGKDGFDGSMVADAWANGEHDKIIEYAKSDVEVARSIWRKFQAVDW